MSTAAKTTEIVETSDGLDFWRHHDVRVCRHDNSETLVRTQGNWHCAPAASRLMFASAAAKQCYQSGFAAQTRSLAYQTDRDFKTALAYSDDKPQGTGTAFVICRLRHCACLAEVIALSMQSQNGPARARHPHRRKPGIHRFRTQGA